MDRQDREDRSKHRDDDEGVRRRTEEAVDDVDHGDPARSQRHAVAEIESKYGPKGPPMRVEARDEHNQVIAIWEGQAFDAMTPGASYVATRTGGGWAWDDDTGQTVHVQVGRKHKGTPVERWAPKGAVWLLVTIGAPSSELIPEGKGVGGEGTAEEGTGTGEGTGRDVRTGKEKELPSAVDIKLAEPSTGKRAPFAESGQGTTEDAVVRRDGVRDGRRDGQSVTGSPSSRGTSEYTEGDGDSEGEREGPSARNETMSGSLAGSEQGAAGNMRTHGRATGKRTGEGTVASIVPNPKAEQGKIEDPNIPEDGGRVGGMPGGEQDAKLGGVPGAGAVWPLIKVPTQIAPAVAAGMILADADLRGIGDDLVEHAIKAAGKVRRKAMSQLRSLAKKEITALVKKDMEAIEAGLRAEPDFVRLSAKEQAKHLEATEQAIEREAYDKLAKELDDKIKEYEGWIALSKADAAKGADPDVAQAVLKDSEQYLAAAQDARKAIDDLNAQRLRASSAEPEQLVPGYPRDVATKKTVDHSAWYASERDARSMAKTHLGRDPVQVEPGKLRSRDGRWQYRGKPEDLLGHRPTDTPHIHLERLDPETGKVLENWHLRW